MYKIRVGITEVQDKKFLKELCPIFIWMLACFFLLFLVCRTPYYWITVPLLFIAFLMYIPIMVIIYKRTAKFRNRTYRKTTLTFEVLDGKVYLDGKEVGITMNADAQFIINTSDFEGYAVRISDTQEFLEFLELNDIPYIGLASEVYEEIKDEINVMSNWFEFEFNKPYKGDEITRVNDVMLPEQYLNFMREHNGGVGDIGETWLVLYGLEDLQEINEGYDIERFLPNHIIIGSNGAGELYGLDSQGNYFNVPVIIEEECISYLGNDIEKLPNRINELWSNMR